MTTMTTDPKGRARRFLQRRPSLSPLTLKVLVASFLMLTANATLIERTISLLADKPAMIAGLLVIAFATNLFCISVFTLPFTVRPVLAAMLVLGAVASYFQDQLGVVIDRDMLQNAVNTTGNESRHLMTSGFLVQLIFLGLLPAALVLWTRPKPLH